jgi:hypothetical protein
MDTDTPTSSPAAAVPTTEQLLLQLLTQLAQGNTATNEAIQQALSAAGSSKKKERLPILSKFDGNRGKFEGWELEARNKLLTDGDTIGTSQDQMNYIYAALEGSARSMSRAFVETTGHGNTGSGTLLLDYLKRNFGDPNRSKRAMDKLQQLQQLPNESFARFLPKFETLMADAGILGLEDPIKISMLEKALNQTMKWSLVSSITPTTFAEYVSHLQTIGSRIDGLKQKGTKPQNPVGQRNQGDKMDWEPTPIQQTQGQAKQQRAKWVSQEEIQKRRNEGSCLRCGRKGHLVLQCSMLPARRPLASNRACEVQQRGDETLADDESSKE